MISSTSDEDGTPRRPHDDIPDGEQQSRIDRARRDGARSTIDRDSAPEDIAAAFCKHSLLEPREIGAVAYAETVRVTFGRRWFILQTKPAAEAVAVEAIAKAGSQACAPEIAEWVVSHRKEIVRLRPLFPRYVFVGLDPDARGDIDFRTPRLCDGVAGYVKMAGGMAEVRDTVVGDLMFANQRRWVDFIWSKAMKDRPKRRAFATQGFGEAMNMILDADPRSRLKLFLDRFGKRGALLHCAGE